MSFYVKVTAGADAGKTFRVDAAECVIGRAPSSTIVLHDESVAWEHAVLRADNGRIVLQNLAAAGTRVRGHKVDEDLRLAGREELELSEQCKLVVQHRLGRGIGWRLNPLTLAAIVVGLAVLGGLGYAAFKPEPPPFRPVLDSHWEQAYRRLDARIETWVGRRWFPTEAQAIYRDAWRLELAVNPEAANRLWGQLRALLLTIPVPGPEADEDQRTVTIAENAGPNSKALGVVMGWDRESSGDFRWNTDAAYADALAWFVRRRWERTREALEGRR